MVSTYTLNELINTYAAVFSTGFFIGTTVIMALVFLTKVSGKGGEKRVSLGGRKRGFGSKERREGKRRGIEREEGVRDIEGGRLEGRLAGRHADRQVRRVRG